MENLFTSEKAFITNLALDIFTSERNELALKLKGFATSPGIIKGPCTVLRNMHELRKLEYGAILVCEKALPTMVMIIPFLGGLVTERGGILSTTAGYARMYKVPMVVGVKGLMGAARTGDIIRINGARGAVDIIRKGISLGRA